jgi:hypothetical protein
VKNNKRAIWFLILTLTLASVLIAGCDGVMPQSAEADVAVEPNVEAHYIFEEDQSLDDLQEMYGFREVEFYALNPHITGDVVPAYVTFQIPEVWVMHYKMTDGGCTFYLESIDVLEAAVSEDGEGLLYFTTTGNVVWRCDDGEFLANEGWSWNPNPAETIEAGCWRYVKDVSVGPKSPILQSDCEVK